MIKGYGIILFFVCFGVLNAQTGSKSISYSLQLNERVGNTEAHYNMLTKNIMTKLQSVKFELSFSRTEAEFHCTDKPLSPEDFDIILDMCDMIGEGIYIRKGCDSIITYNRKFESVSKFSYYLDNSEWFLLDETKVINGISCKKAFTTFRKDYGDGQKMDLYDVVAWYDPDVDCSFGPRGFQGLPGLILELELPLVIFTASSQLQDSEHLIQRPQGPVPEFQLYESMYEK